MAVPSYGSASRCCLLRDDLDTYGWPFANYLRFPSLVAAVRGDGHFCISCSAGGAAVEMTNDLCFEIMVFDTESCELIFGFFPQTFQFRVCGAEVCSSLDNSESGFLCGGPVGSVCTEPTSRLPNTDRWVDCADALDSWEQYSFEICHICCVH